MADVGAYTGIPDTLPEAQAEIVRLCDDLKRADKRCAETAGLLDEAVAMIEAGRAALNAIEKPATS